MLKRADTYLKLEETKLNFKDCKVIKFVSDNIVSDEEIKSLIISDLNIQLSLCFLYDNYLLFKGLSNSQVPSSGILLLSNQNEDEQIEKYSKIFKNLRLVYYKNELVDIANSDLGENTARIINIYKNLLKSRLVNMDIVDNFLSYEKPNYDPDFLIKQNIVWYEYINKDDFTSSKNSEDFLDLFLNSKVNSKEKYIFLNSYISKKELEEKAYLSIWSKKVKNLFVRDYGSGSLIVFIMD